MSLEYEFLKSIAYTIMVGGSIILIGLLFLWVMHSTGEELDRYDSIYYDPRTREEVIE